MIANLLRARVLRHMPASQRALRKGEWNATHAHIIDAAVFLDQRYHGMEGKPLHVAWIDYSKAYDSIPHDLLEWTLLAIRVHPRVVSSYMGMLKALHVTFETRVGAVTGASTELDVRRGVPQGDTLSPLLFCLAIAPISKLIEACLTPYMFSRTAGVGEIRLTHQFYMDDLKLYSESVQSLHDTIGEMVLLCQAMGLEVNTRKCALASFGPGQPGLRTDMPLLTGNEVYKYLGLEQQNGVALRQVFERVTELVLERTRNIFSSAASHGKKVASFNAAVAPIVRYVCGNLFLYDKHARAGTPLARAKELDVKIRALLSNLQVRFSKHPVHHLYLSSRHGGWGLSSFEEIASEAIVYAYCYLMGTAGLTDLWMTMCSQARRGKRSLVTDFYWVMGKPDCEGLEVYRIDGPQGMELMLGSNRYMTPRSLARAVCTEMRERINARRNRLLTNLEGYIARNVELDKEMSYLWIRRGALNSTTVSNISSLLFTGIHTNAHPARRLPRSQRGCRYCGQLETNEHVAMICGEYKATVMKERHDAVARKIYDALCLVYQLRRYHYDEPIPVEQRSAEIELYWDKVWLTPSEITCNRPDIVLVDHSAGKVLMVEVAVCWPTRIRQMEEFKVRKYEQVYQISQALEGGGEQEASLCSILSAQFQCAAKVVPFVIGCCGEVSKDASAYLRELGLTDKQVLTCMELAGRSAVLGTDRVIRNHLARV
ncbi:unnamed protein product [Caenorhabditis auriculariae]|uniref:Reverse transcriptase domain-containing protein n=1 Tax=Caenorhabditis auriculariae TaxID=2777116 RepID=A0A8S1I0U0_9PELO|nr:unnamed protein product [Caenorhabditis auriculariae]